LYTYKAIVLIVNVSIQVMRNPISATYQLFDDTLMYGVNKTVYAWNWSTGYTKEDLANVLNLAGYPLFCSSVFYKYPLAYFVAVPFGIVVSLATSSMNSDYGNRELQAASKGLLDPKVEMHKRNCKANGYVLTFGDIFLTIKDRYTEYDAIEANQLFGIKVGLGLVGISNIVMCADPLPPRKNVFSRAVDRAAELYEEYKKPVLQPAGISD